MGTQDTEGHNMQSKSERDQRQDSPENAARIDEGNRMERLRMLRQPFPENQISHLPKGGVQLSYVGHAALTDRLLDADLSWEWEPLAYTPEGLPRFDEAGGLWIRLTVCGVTRLGYGNAMKKPGPGDREKEVIGDALRNAAMRFGAALDLWHKGELHAHQDDSALGEPGMPMSPNPTPEEEAVAFLAKFDEAKTIDEVEAINLSIKDRWHVFRNVKGMTESVAAMRKSARVRIRRDSDIPY
jgi:hypothetical protein